MAAQGASTGWWRAGYVQRRLHPTVDIPEIQAPPDVAAAMRQELDSVADVVMHSVSATTANRSHVIWGEFSGFMRAYGLDVNDAEPVDICRFLDSDYSTSMQAP